MKTIDGLVFRADGRLWRVFDVRWWQLGRWAGWLWRRLRGVARRTQRLTLPEGARVVRAEEVRTGGSRLVRQAALGGRR